MSHWININFLPAPTGAEKWQVGEECSTGTLWRQVGSRHSSGWYWNPALSALFNNQGDDERSMCQEQTRLHPVLQRGLPCGHVSRWHITNAGGCGWKRKGRGGEQEKRKEGQLTESLFFEPGGISLGNSSKDHRQLTARDVQQFCSPNTAPPSLI